MREWLPLVLVVGYVAPFYLRPRAARDEPSTIYFRSVAILLWCSVAWLPLRFELASNQGGGEARSKPPLHQLLGLQREGCLQAVAIPVAVTALLFAGPLWLTLGETTSRAVPSFSHACLWPFTGWSAVALRRFIVAPLAEEFVFRACLAPLVLLQGWSLARTQWLSPLFFGLAHVQNHILNVLFQGVPLQDALVQAVFQVGYTTVFGWYATYLFLRTGHFAAPLAAHVFCNWMGFPDFPGILRHPRARLALPVGILAFALLLHPLTRPILYSPDALPVDDVAPAVRQALQLGHMLNANA
eukprot:jgi/Botrbrau1/22889/Bobra.0065s0042.1